MSDIPRIAVDAYALNEDEARVHLGRIDFTAVIAELIARSPSELGRLLGNPESGTRTGIFVSDIANALPMDVRPVAWDGRLQLPGLREAIQAAAERVGGDFTGLHGACTRIRDSQWRLEQASRELARLASARWETDTSGFAMFFGTQFRDDYEADMDEAAEGWGLDAFAAIDPCPKGWEGPEYDAWVERHATWVRANMQPYAYATAENPWPGISLARIREAAEDEDGPDIEGMIESDMEDHHEDASEQVVAVEDMTAAVKTWMAQGGLVGGDDASLADAIKAWNARQTITSFNPDLSVALPVFADATRDEALAFAKGRVVAANAALEAAQGSWRVCPASEAQPSPALEMSIRAP